MRSSFYLELTLGVLQSLPDRGHSSKLLLRQESESVLMVTYQRDGRAMDVTAPTARYPFEVKLSSTRSLLQS